MIALEERLRQTEEVLVAERLARQTAEAAQQTVGPQPAAGGGGGERPPGLPSIVDTKAIGKPPTFRWRRRRERAGSDLQRAGVAGGPTSPRRVRVRGVETAVQRVSAPSSVTIPRNAPSPLVANENGRSGADNLSMGEQSEGLRGTKR